LTFGSLPADRGSSVRNVTTVSPPRFEHLDDPIAITTEAPRLSWRATTDAENWVQRAYEVCVEGSDGAVLWASGRIDSDQQVLVPWGGPPLRSRTSGRARVRVWGSDGSASAWSGPTPFAVALLDRDDWVGRFVAVPWEEQEGPSRPAVRFRRCVTLPAPVTRALLRTTALGLVTAEVNGAAAHDDVLVPGWTSYRHRVVYATTDVTALLREGVNVIGLTLADGWFRGRINVAGHDRYGTQAAVLAQLEVECADGTCVIVGTDESWRAGPSPVLAADLYDGETHDARLTDCGWSAPGFDDSCWASAAELRPQPAIAVSAPTGPLVRRTQELAVAEVITTPSGATVLDFGQNISGRIRLRVHGPAGTEVVLRHSELMLNGELAPGNLRSAKATDRYILAGSGKEEWEPSFTVHGFRYVQVEGWPGTLDADDVTALVIHSDLRRTGTFRCSHELVQSLHDNIVWSLRGNVVSIPTDCPQRDERLGWTGDIQVFAPTAAFLYDCAGFLGSWLADLALDQRPNGAVTFVVPYPPGDASSAGAGWGDAATVVPWELYLASGDVSMLQAQYESMCRWVDLLDRLCGPKRLWSKGFQFGDHLDPSGDSSAGARTDPYFIATAFVVRSASIVADAAEILGRWDDAAHYRVLAEDVRAAFQSEYVTPNGRLASDSQAAYALALAFGLLPDASRQRAGDRLAELVRHVDHTIGTGFLGTPAVLDALSATGHDSTAFALLTQTRCPSWLYPVTCGATTIWERWDSLLPDGSMHGHQMNSLNHYAFGAVAAWLHKHLGGISPLEPGYRRALVAPHPGPGFTSATTTLDTPYGDLSCAWSVVGQTVTVRVVVPAGAAAKVVLPGGVSHEVGSGCRTWSYDVSADVLATWSPQPALSMTSPLSQLVVDASAWEVCREMAPALAVLYDHVPAVGEQQLRQLVALVDPERLGEFEGVVASVVPSGSDAVSRTGRC